MSLLNEKYSKIVCINLKERPDKKEYIQKQFDKYDIKFEWYHPVILNYSRHFIEAYDLMSTSPRPVYDTIIRNNNIVFNKTQPNEFGTMNSFYTVLKSALLDGIENLFVFEDDFSFHKDWNQLLPKYLNTIPGDADAILLYSYMAHLYPQNIKVSSRWVKGYKSWSHIAIGMNKKFIKEYIKQIDMCPRIADLVTYEMMEDPLKFNVYVAIPVLGIPSKHFESDIRGTNKNYDKIQNIFTFGLDASLYD